jgi:hypothetical protein
VGLRPLVCSAKIWYLHNSFQAPIYAARRQKTNLDQAHEARDLITPLEVFEIEKERTAIYLSTPVPQQSWSAQFPFVHVLVRVTAVT